MNPLRDDKDAFFRKLTRGERVRLMMQHAYEIQCSSLFKPEREALAESRGSALAAEMTKKQTKRAISVFGEYYVDHNTHAKQRGNREAAP